MGGDLQRHRVAVSVFATVDAIDYTDAGHIVTRAVEHAIGDRTLTVTRPGMKWTVQVHDVMDTGMALGNGYLWAKPTAKAYPRYEDGES